MTTLNSTALVSSKREGRNIASLLALQSLQPSVQASERLWVLLFFLVDSNECLSEVFPYNKRCLKRHCFCLLWLLQHMSKHEMQFMCVQQLSVLRSDLYNWCKRVSIIAHTNKQNWLEQQAQQVSSSFLLDKQTQRIPKLSNFWIWAKLCTWNCPFW